MQIAAIPVDEYPVVGISKPSEERRYAFVARSEFELKESPLLDYLRGMSREQYFVSSIGKFYKASNFRITGIGWGRIRRVGYIISILKMITCLSIPIIVQFDLHESDKVCSIDDLKKEIRIAFKSFPNAYFTWRSEWHVRRKLNQAKNFIEVADAIS